MKCMRTLPLQNSECRIWQLQLPNINVKHMLFSHSKDFRAARVFLDDDLTRQQLHNPKRLAGRRAHLSGLGHKT